MRLLRGLTSKILPCGCSVGVYETYEGAVISTIDARGEHCPHQEHRRRARLMEPPADDAQLPVRAKYQ